MSLVKHEKLEKNTSELQIAIDAEAFKSAISEVFRKDGKKFNVPGFRKGKAPRSVIEKMYGADVFHYDAVNELFPQAFEDAAKEADVEPVDRPEVDIVSMSIDDGVVLKVKVTTKPEIEVGTYKGLEAEKAANTVEDAAIDAEINRMAERNARIITSEAPAKNGDIANINFEGFADGVAFEGGKGESFPLTLGSGQFIPGFEEQIVGHNTGDEFDVNVTFPEQYQAEELAGKAAIFKCKLNKLECKEMPVIDDEFAKDVSEYDTLAELKDSIRKNLEEQAEKEAELNLENALVDQIVAGIKGDIPECMFAAKTDEMVNDFAHRLQSQGLQLEMYLQYMNQTMDAFREGFKENAEKQVKMRLALEKIVALEGLKATEEEIDAEIQRIADAYKMEADKVRGLVPVEEIAKDLAANKAIDLIKANAKIKASK